MLNVCKIDINNKLTYDIQHMLHCRKILHLMFKILQSSIFLYAMYELNEFKGNENNRNTLFVSYFKNCLAGNQILEMGWNSGVFKAFFHDVVFDLNNL